MTCSRCIAQALIVGCCLGILCLPVQAAPKDFPGLKAKIKALLDTHQVPVIMTNSDNGSKVFEPIEQLIRTSRR